MSPFLAPKGSRNTLFFTYGDISPLNHLNYLSYQLSGYEKAQQQSVVLPTQYKAIPKSFVSKTSYPFPKLVDYSSIPLYSFSVPTVVTDEKEMNFSYYHVYPLNISFMNRAGLLFPLLWGGCTRRMIEQYL